MPDDSSLHSCGSQLPGPSCASVFSNDDEGSDLKSTTNSKSVDNDDWASCSEMMSLRECSSSTERNNVTAAFETEVVDDESELNVDAAFAGELAVDRLLQRILTERMFELRRIQHGDRPVTGSRTRETLNNFFSRALNPSAYEPEVASHRPETVQDEVQSLSRSSVVSSALRSVQFRQSIEQSLRGMATANAPPPSRPPSNRITTPIRATPPIERQINAIRRPPSARPAPPPSHTEALRSVDNAVEQNHDSAYWNAMLAAGMQLLSESVNTDLNDLQGLRIVSSVLRGSFRQDLEHLVQSHVSSVGGGRDVPLRTAPIPQRSPAVQRQPIPAEQNTTNFQFPTVPRGVSNAQLANDVRQLQSHVNDMKHMLGLMFEMQMDTQRALRQEVSAVFTAFMESHATQTDTSAPRVGAPLAPRSTPPVSGGVCTICLEKSVDTVLYKCGHLCVCYTCGLQLKMKGHNCPICRAPIDDIVRAFQSQ